MDRNQRIKKIIKIILFILAGILVISWLVNSLLYVSGSGCSCVDGDKYNCDDFRNRAEAQMCLERCGTSSDVHNLDSDNNGFAC